MAPGDPEKRSADWAWGVPLIVLTVLAHGFGLALIYEFGVGRLAARLQMRRTATVFAAIVATTVLLLTALHAAEASVWAGAYVALGALDEPRSAMPSAQRDDDLRPCDILGLAPHWRLMGAIEALNGMMLFGLTTAYLFAVLQNHWPTHARDQAPPSEPGLKGARGRRPIPPTPRTRSCGRGLRPSRRRRAAAGRSARRRAPSP